ncbi:MAG: hypothetical protein SH850_22545 [Planctomycetaceae bacterium]|nr:hypothetical protein [Planctomycetaceae bacterium]
MSDPPEYDPLPPHVRRFAPWMWFPWMKPWQRWTLAVTVVLAGYVLWPVPMLWVVQRLGGVGARETMTFTVYLPIVAICELVPSLDRDFYESQDDWLRSVIGEP